VHAADRQNTISTSVTSEPFPGGLGNGGAGGPFLCEIRQEYQRHPMAKLGKGGGHGGIL